MDLHIIQLLIVTFSLNDFSAIMHFFKLKKRTNLVSLLQKTITNFYLVSFTHNESMPCALFNARDCNEEDV